MNNNNGLSSAVSFPSVPFLGIRETCKATGLSQWFLRKGVEAGTIPYIRSGNKILINVPALLEALDRESRKASGI